MKKLQRDFYLQPTLKVAKNLLGCILVTKFDGEITSGKIVETEAYIGPNDKGSHAYNNRKSKRTSIQYGPGGYAYIFKIYGNLHCFCIVTEKENMPEVVLIRALEPIEGNEIMAKRRNIELSSNKDIVNLCNGPSKLCQSLGININHYGVDLCADSIYILQPSLNNIAIKSSERINIDYAEKCKHYPWRFYIRNNDFVSC